MTFSELDAKLTGRNQLSRKVGNNTYAIRNDNGSIGIRLHNTQVIVFQTNGDVVLNSGGWHTVTTKARMNEFLPKPWRVAQRNYAWYLGNWQTGEIIGYSDGMVLPAAMLEVR